MPLIDQQDVVTVTLSGMSSPIEALIPMLTEQLKAYPPVRIVSVSVTKSSAGASLVAVIETV